MYQIAMLFMRFIMYSLIGYLFETLVCFIVDKKLSNRGFLCGPIIPIYGIGCIALTYFLKPFKNHFLLVILLGALLTSTLEYTTGYLLEKIFHNKWWDYSKRKYNLHGRICLEGILIFALGTPLIIYVLDPIIISFFLEFEDSYFYIISLIIFVIFLIDVIYSIIVAYNLRHRIIIVEELKRQKLVKIPGMLERALKIRLEGMKKYPRRLIKAFPSILKNKEKEFAIMEIIDKNNKQKKKKHH